MSMGPRILTFDLETSPHLSYHFGTRNINISPIQNVEPSRVISWAAKWRDQKTISYLSEYETERELMVRGAFTLLDEADVLVGYNSDGFDIPHLQREFDLMGLGVPSPFVSVDLYKVVKKNFRQTFLSNKLGYVTSQLSLSGKLEYGGYFPLWLKMISDDPDVRRRAWNVFKRYNRRDVLTTEELFDLLRSRITSIPAAALYGDEIPDRMTCPQCGSEDFTKRGWRYTKSRRYQTYFCNACTRRFSDLRSDGSAGVG